MSRTQKQRMRSGRGPMWTVPEERLLAKLYEMADEQNIMQAIPCHTWEAIRSHAAKLGLRRAKAFRKARNVHPIIAELRAIRLKKKLFVLRLATMIGRHENTLLHWENCNTEPPFRAVVDWANALGYDFVLVAKAPGGSTT